MTRPEPEFEELYRDIILDHYRRPRHRGVLDPADVDLAQNNPLCGDEVRVTLRLRDGRIEDVGFVGQGCSISQSSASMMVETLQGRSLQDAVELAAAFRRMLQGQPADEERMGQLLALRGVFQFPVRIRCAVLAWDTFQKGLEGYKGRVRA